MRDSAPARPHELVLPELSLPVPIPPPLYELGTEANGYDVLFPETLRVLASKGSDLVCAPTLLDFPNPIGLPPTKVPHLTSVGPDEYDPEHYIIWRVRAAEHNVYLAVANWSGQAHG